MLLCRTNYAAHSKYFYPFLMATSSALMSSHYSHFSIFQFLIIFSGTFIGYYLAILKPELDFPKKKILINEKKIILVFFFTILYFALASTPLDFSTLIQYGLASMLSISYYTRFTTLRGSFYGTRSILLVKNIVLALAWAFVTSPLGEEFISSFLLFMQRFFFIFALSVSIDLRDIEKDRGKIINTFPIKYGFTKTKLLAIILILLSSTLVYLYNVNSRTDAILMASLISGTLSIIGILSLHPQSKNEHYLLIIDGNLLLHGLLFFIFA
jgi:4-hydroxybenzoate polyprenyltransferase